MTPSSAACIFSVGILGLFWLDREKNTQVSRSLWLAIVWLFLCCSRSVDQWMGGTQATDSPMEGSPVDRVVYFGLILIGFVIIIRRKQAAKIAKANAPLILSFLYCAASILWSDYPDIAFKRWIKALGDLIIVLVVLSGRDRIGNIKGLLTRTGFLLIPLSILFIKYYPDLGRGYDRWSGIAFYNGVALTKNDMGVICLIIGLSSLWRLLSEIQTRFRDAQMRPMIAQGIMLLMVLWLFRIVNSMTSLWCFLMGATVLVATSFKPVARRMAVVHALVVGAILIPFSMLFLHIGSDIAHGATGRNVSTLTDRTEVWSNCFKLAGNPLFGTGFESFWLGRRLEAMWSVFWWHPNEAHNGYVEMFLNLGWIGTVILAVVIVTGYRNIIASLRQNAPEASLMLAYFTVSVVYNFTEAAFFQMMAAMWVLFLLATMKVPFLDVKARRRSHKNISTELSQLSAVTDNHDQVDTIYSKRSGPNRTSVKLPC